VSAISESVSTADEAEQHIVGGWHYLGVLPNRKVIVGRHVSYWQRRRARRASIPRPVT